MHGAVGNMKGLVTFLTYQVVTVGVRVYLVVAFSVRAGISKCKSMLTEKVQYTVYSRQTALRNVFDPKENFLGGDRRGGMIQERQNQLSISGTFKI